MIAVLYTCVCISNETSVGVGDVLESIRKGALLCGGCFHQTRLPMKPTGVVVVVVVIILLLFTKSFLL